MTLTQCKNDALTIISIITPIEFRHIDHSSTISNPGLSGSTTPIDDDIAMFTTSVLRTQLEIDIMLLLKQQEQKHQHQLQLHQKTSETNFIANSYNYKKRDRVSCPYSMSYQHIVA